MFALTIIAASSSLALAAAQDTSAPILQRPGEIVQSVPGSGASPSTAQSGPTWQSVQGQIAGDSSIAASVANWKRLNQSDNWTFDDYAAFMIANPGWPGEMRMRGVAEGRIDPNNGEPSRVLAYFDRFPPTSATGFARQAVALQAMGRTAEAKVAARTAWVKGALSPDDESRLLSYFSSALTTADHDQRADMLLFARANGGAERLLSLVSHARRPLFEARIAMQRKSPDASIKATSAEGAGGLNDAGYLADKANWLRDSGNSPAARNLLASRPPLSTRPANAEKWFEAMLTMARGAANDGQSSLAYAIASKVDDAYAPGVDVRDQSLGERDDYTSLTWLAGWTAMYGLNRPADAVGMFERYGRGARSPQTVSKGYYWAGRAALAAGDRMRADSYFTQAGQHADQFYGQLALERLGRTIPRPADANRAVQLSATQRTAFSQSSIVRAAQYLGRTGQWEDQSKFIRAIAATADSDENLLMASELARSINRPDLGVMVGRRAKSDGLSGYGEASFPRVSVPSSEQYNWTMIHAIARQESQFDRAARSHAGALGLMQLMPGTAREQAGKVGLSYTPGALTADTTYNIQLGSAYFQRMLSYYGGSYPLAVAAYNAGPGNVNKWIAANGDPRLPGADMLRWIEQIPIFETRNYVQRVLENAVVYDTMNPGSARGGGTMPLSKYLGKNTPG